MADSKVPQNLNIETAAGNGGLKIFERGYWIGTWIFSEAGLLSKAQFVFNPREGDKIRADTAEDAALRTAEFIHKAVVLRPRNHLGAVAVVVGAISALYLLKPAQLNFPIRHILVGFIVLGGMNWAGSLWTG